MNGQRDIERTLDLWLVDGPSVMPDRLFDAVLDRVERTPQRRLARLPLRLTDMNPRIRLYTAAAAVLVVALAGIYLLNRAPGPSVGASPSPGVTPSSGVTPSPGVTPDPTPGGPLPAAMQGRWMGGANPWPQSPIDPLSGTSLVVTADQIAVTPSNEGDRHIVPSLASDLGEGHLRLELDHTGDGCTDGDLGSYTWSVSPGGRRLSIEPLEDACSMRMNSFPGDWWKMDCPTSDNFCLGPLDAGDYGSQFFDPFVAPGEPWKPRVDALHYFVPDGWINDSDWPNSFGLQPEGSPQGRQVFLYSDIVVVSDAEPCSETTAETTVGETPTDIKNWLLTAEGLVAENATAVTVGELPGWRVDVSMDRKWTATCPFSDGNPYRGLFIDRAAGAGFAWGIDATLRVRLYLLDLGDGRSLLVAIQGPADADSEAFVQSATSIVETFLFTPEG